MSRKFLSTLRLTNLASDPEGGSEGDIYFNSIDKTLKFYNGTNWVALADSASSSSQTYLVDHTHSYDGDLAEIFPQNIIYMNDSNSVMEYSQNYGIVQENPIFAFDGGSPTTSITDPSPINFTLIDGGSVV